jgi:flagellar biosynthesis anti-sigma factor FlgM
MKIMSNQIQQVVSTYLKQVKKNDSSPDVEGSQTPTDEVSVSEEAGSILKARQAYDNLPDVRADRIAEIQAKLAKGTYQLDDSKIADAILRETSLSA